jgi:hypothetical protein
MNGWFKFVLLCLKGVLGFYPRTNSLEFLDEQAFFSRRLQKKLEVLLLL